MDLRPGRGMRAIMAATACAALVAGCGGGDKDSSRADVYGSGSSLVERRVASAPPLGETGANALPESGPTYKPTGEIVADSGFRPEVDGFAFQNYTNDDEPQNLRPVDMARLFGDQVCLEGTTGEDCVLIPVAETWMASQNEGMAGGHCMGFSVATLRMFADKLEPADYGSEVANDLELVGNNELQATIAESFVYQVVPSIADLTERGSPAQILDKLVKYLKAGKEHHTLGIYMADGTAGHAITPLAVEDQGDGKYVVLVYDNNYPSVTRPLYIDKAANTFEYSGATDPSKDQQPYTGDATTNNLDLTPTLVGEGQQPCPFCNGEEGEEATTGRAGGSKGTVLPKDQQFSELSLTGDQENHPHIVITDEEGRQTGIVEGKLVEDIPGVKMVRQFAQDDIGGAPEPRYQIKPGLDVNISIDGSALERPSKGNQLDFAGNGLVISVQDIDVAPGQVDNVFISGEGYGLYYEFNGADADSESNPVLTAGVVDKDASYVFGAAAVGIKKGSTMGLLVDQEEGIVELDSSGSKGALEGKGAFGISLVKTDKDGESIWSKGLTLDGKQEETADFLFREGVEAGEPIDMLVSSEKTGKERFVKLKPE